MRRSATKQVSESAHIEATTPSNALGADGRKRIAIDDEAQRHERHHAAEEVEDERSSVELLRENRDSMPERLHPNASAGSERLATEGLSAFRDIFTSASGAA
jgi:hypothetical protein